MSNGVRCVEQRIYRIADKFLTVDSKGRASKAVLRRIMLDISIWLFLAQSILKTSFLTFLGLKQKWQSTLSGWIAGYNYSQDKVIKNKNKHQKKNLLMVKYETYAIFFSYFLRSLSSYQFPSEIYGELERDRKTAAHCSSVHPRVKWQIAALWCLFTCNSLLYTLNDIHATWWLMK